MIRQIRDGILTVLDKNGEEVFSLSEELEEGIFSVCCSGEIRNEAAYDFTDEIMTALSVCHQLRVDLRQVSYLASTALSGLLAIQQQTDGLDDAQMVLVLAQGPVLDLLTESGLSEVFLMETDG